MRTKDEHATLLVPAGRWINPVDQVSFTLFGRSQTVYALVSQRMGGEAPSAA